MYRLAALTCLLLLLFAARVALADVELAAGVGGGIGTLHAASTTSVQTTPISLAFSVETSSGALKHAKIGAIMEYQLISFNNDGSVFNGTDLLLGVALGIPLVNFESSFIRCELGYYPQSTLTVTTDTTADLNGKAYSHSTLATYTGVGATELKLIYLVESNKGQFNKYERLRYGVALSEFFQPIKKVETKIVTSNPDLQPTTILDDKVSYSLNLTSVAFIVAFAM